MSYQTDQQRADERSREQELNCLLQSYMAEKKLATMFYCIEEYHEPSNQQRSGYWVEVVRVSWADAHTLPNIWALLPGRLRLVTEDRTVIVAEDFGQKLEIVIS